MFLGPGDYKISLLLSLLRNRVLTYTSDVGEFYHTHGTETREIKVYFEFYLSENHKRFD